MQTIQSVNEMQSRAISMRSSGHLIGLVPTMGSLHEGHLSLVDIAREKADKVIVSIFVNPTQFGPSEDFEHYPRSLESDLELCEQRGVDLVFNPSAEEMYARDFSTYVVEERLGTGLCGISRPHHFRGVTTVCTKLFNITRPDCAVFGQKDAQQSAIIRKMVRDLNLPVEILTGPIIREPDGLALSSRNRYLTPELRENARLLPQAVSTAAEMVAKGTRSVDRVVAEVTHILSQSHRVRLIYAKIVDRETMEPASREIEPGRHLLAIAAWVDEVRLIDNVML